MKYYSTRGGGEGIESAYAIKQGLADDGGLFMPESIPQLTEDKIRELCGMDYAHRAAYILSLYLTDYTYDELLEDCLTAYGDDRFPGGAAPVAKLNDSVSVLELWHGPTCAFKDMALQIMPRLLSRALKKTGEKRTAFILVATSGDTGKAALDGYHDVDGVNISVFYPVDGVSKIQKKQMATQEGSNVFVTAVRGNFDDAQTGVKRIFSDTEAAKRMDRAGYFLSSANSINWGRLAPQIAYYVSAYCDLVNREDIKVGDKIDFCVPTGNFGNIFAAFLARSMGLPVERLVCASNANNILTDFLETGVYDRNRAFFTTMSPSMDILISSNLERLLYLAGGSEKTAGYMRQLNTSGKYAVSDDIKAKLDLCFKGYFASEEETSDTIRDTFKKSHYLCDTHTSVALTCANKYGADGFARPIVVVSTASPYKFAADVLASVGGTSNGNEFAPLDELERISGVPIPSGLASLRSKEIRFDRVIDPADMLDEVYVEMGVK